MLKTLFVISMILSASICVADQPCKNLAKKVLESKGDQSNLWILSICKAKPDDVGKSILVVDHQIFLVDSKNGHIFSQGEPGIAPDNIDSIDTGRYWLSAKVRAFGLRSYEYRPHYQAAETLYTLNLYVTEGSRIRPVLEGLAIGYSTSSTECNEKDECTENQSNQQVTIDIAKTSHNGFKDLIVSGKLLSYDGAQYVVPNDLLQQ